MQIKRRTREMMAKVSELSMHQAEALRLQQEIREKESELEHGYINLEKGMPPNRDTEQEWLRQLQLEDQRQQERDTAKQVGCC